MAAMILKMSFITSLYILLTVFLWKIYQNKTLTLPNQILVGIIYGLCSILSTHFGVNFGDMVLNVRDIGPLAAGLFFHPLAGLLSGLIGGIERYIVGTYFGVGSYSRIACSLSTCLAGILSMVLSKFVFKGKKPSAFYAAMLGAVMEVFHMYVVFITHRGDMKMAFYVVRACSFPMIIFTGLGMMGCSIAIYILSGELRKPPANLKGEDVSVSQRFQVWLFMVMTLIIVSNIAFGYITQTQSAIQEAETKLELHAEEVKKAIKNVQNIDARMNSEDKSELKIDRYDKIFSLIYINDDNSYEMINYKGRIIAGTSPGVTLSQDSFEILKENIGKASYFAQFMGEECLCHSEQLEEDLYLITLIPSNDIYTSRDIQVYESIFANILLFAVIYMLISFLVQQIVINNLLLINNSLAKITNGNLNEIVAVRDSSEFASLSDDINQTVNALKGYIRAAEKRIEEELVFAHTIQDQSLPKNFIFARNDFEIYATMKPAKEVGGDFYDFFFVSPDKLALVIADVSGKGIPAALFMMKAKTAIRSLAESGKSPTEIFKKANETLCEGNDAEMFVTAWLGIIDLTTGVIECVNAGHEYPVIYRAKEDQPEYTLFKDKHTLPLAAMDFIRPKAYEISLLPGDRLLVYTDGVPEAINEGTEAYGTDRILEKLNSTRPESAVETLVCLQQDVNIFKGEAEQFDDITMLEFIYQPEGSEPEPDRPPVEEMNWNPSSLGQGKA